MERLRTRSARRQELQEGHLRSRREREQVEGLGDDRFRRHEVRRFERVETRAASVAISVRRVEQCHERPGVNEDDVAAHGRSAGGTLRCARPGRRCRSPDSPPRNRRGLEAPRRAAHRCVAGTHRSPLSRASSDRRHAARRPDRGCGAAPREAGCSSSPRGSCKTSGCNVQYKRPDAARQTRAADSRRVRDAALERLGNGLPEARRFRSRVVLVIVFGSVRKWVEVAVLG